MLLLVQFLYRLSFGMAAAMVVTSPRSVTSGYFRNNAYVLLGLNALAAPAAWSIAADSQRTPVWIPIAAAAASYVSAVCWLYEKPRAGLATLTAVAALGLVGAVTAASVVDKPPTAALLSQANAATSGLLLGTTMAAMLLGHWYLNAPGMRIAPLQKLNLLLGAAVLLQAGVSGCGLAGQLNVVGRFEFVQWLMIGLRCGAGLLGTLLLVVMTRSTLNIPNTQAATGMLYVAVITTFLGELVGQLLSAPAVYPL